MKRIRLTIANLVLGSLLGSGALSCAKSETTSDSRTSWVSMCEEAEDCGDSMRCVCGVCTLECELHSDCTAAAGGHCANAGALGDACVSREEAVCLRQCDEASDCPGSFTCRSGACVPEAEALRADSDEETDAAMSDVSAEPDASSPLAAIDAGELESGESSEPLTDTRRDLDELTDAAAVPGIQRLDAGNPMPSTELMTLDGSILSTPSRPKVATPVDMSCGPDDSSGTVSDGGFLPSAWAQLGCPARCEDNGLQELCAVWLAPNRVSSILADRGQLLIADWGTQDSLQNHLGDGTVFTWREESGLEVLVAEQFGPAGLSSDSNHLFWATSASPDGFNGDLWRAGHDGQEPSRLLAEHAFSKNPAVRFVRDGGALYWQDPDNRWRISVADGDGGVLSPGEAQLVGEANAFDWDDGELFEADPSVLGPDGEVLSPDEADLIEVVGQQVFYRSEGQLYAVPREGGRPVRLSSDGVLAVAEGSGALYWAGWTGIYRTPVADPTATKQLLEFDNLYVGSVTVGAGVVYILAGQGLVFVLPEP